MTVPRTRKKDYPTMLKSQVGLWLKKAPRGSQKIVAQALDVSERTLLNWKTAAAYDTRRGRKPAKCSFSEIRKIITEWTAQGYPGSRPIIKALPGVRARLIRDVIAKMKLRRRNRSLKRIESLRTKVTVKDVGTVVTMDGATLKKGDDLIVVRDRGSLSVNASSCEGSLCSAHTVSVLEQLKAKGRLPLVFCSDNGSPFCAEIVKTFLTNNKIIHLRSLPRVPQHNAACENAVSELKHLLREGLSVEAACDTLNKRRRRQRLNWQTTEEVEGKNTAQYDEQKRQEFYETTMLAVKQAKLGTNNEREKRKAEREAILNNMVSFSIITKNRGNQTNLKPVRNA